MRTLWNRIKDEPILVWQVIAACIALASSFGFDLTATQTAAIFGVCQALAAMVGRQLVTPVRKVRRQRAGSLEAYRGRR